MEQLAGPCTAGRRLDNPNTWHVQEPDATMWERMRSTAVLILARSHPELLFGPLWLELLATRRRSAASARDYRRIRQYADEFRKRRTIYGQQDQDRRS